jgi:hypothetical protein
MAVRGLRFRVWVGGRLLLEEWITAPDHAAVAAVKHAAVALDTGEPWLVEVFDPEAPAAEAYMRFGTDTAGMVDPSAVSLDEVITDLERPA